MRKSRNLGRTVAEILRDSAARIERVGWCQVGSGSDGTRRCIMRAIQDEIDEAGEGVFWHACASALLRHVRPPGGLMSVWNDAPGRTVDEVLAALRGAAAEVESK